MWTMVVMMQLTTISAQSIQNQNWGSGTKNGNQKSKNHLSSYSAYTSFPSYQDTTKPTIGYGFIPRHPIPGYSPTPPEQDSAKCYSCMSTLYEAVWPAISKIFKKPRNFTDDCAEAHISGSRSAPIVHCPTICVSLYETPNIGGFRIQGHIRGCMSDILINGFNQSIVSWYRWMHRDSCRTYRKRELFKLSGIEDDSTIEVCTCYSDFCNGHSTGIAVTFTMLIAPILIALTQALL
ncbi:hypothetical protein WR25_21774 [Diploscapter pachys]|uniref:Uncharacterized protein n=1 Tax=Diploscapter pachys TaxID=2018661 RepID=A0A2A2LFK8_9BILA|nr:hypothetical protein WR25_21774 [Diploscapter pachys]